MAAKRHLGDWGKEPHTVSASVAVNCRLSDKDRFRISDVGRDGLHPGVVESGGVQDHSRRISPIGGGGEGGVAQYFRGLFHSDIVAQRPRWRRNEPSLNPSVRRPRECVESQMSLLDLTA